MLIKKSCVEKIEQADIVQVAQAIGLVLTKKASNYFCKSPYKTNEKTASCSISPSKQIFKCFSSGNGGNVITLVKDVKNVDYPSALKIIAEIANIPLEFEKVTQEKKEQYDALQKMAEANKEACLFFQKTFENLKEDHWAKNFLKEKGFSKEILKKYKVGFATNEVATHLINKNLLSESTELGLIKVAEGRTYTPFFNRIIFPITKNGKVVGFGGRGDGKNSKYAKYINSKESPIYSKTSVLFGLDEAKTSSVKNENIFFTEGYTDVMAMAQSGFENTVCACGTSITPTHFKLTEKYTQNITLLLDGDEAGVKSSEKYIASLLKSGIIPNIISLPKNTDPNDLMIQGALPSYVKDASDGFFFLAKQLKEKTTSIKEKGDAFTKLAGLLNFIQNDFIKEDYKNYLSTLFGTKVATLNTVLKKTESPSPTHTDEQDQQTSLPKGVNEKDYLTKGFSKTDKNNYAFQSGKGFVLGTNFIANPLYHIIGEQNIRLLEIINDQNYKKLIELDAPSFLGFQKFQEKITEQGTFYFSENITSYEYKKIINDLIKKFITAHEIFTLGQQKLGFYAFANGILHNKKFHEINNYGIVTLEEKLLQKKENYNSVNNFYLPAFSEINNQIEGINFYENDSYLKYYEPKVTLKQWSNQFLRVFPDHGKFGFAFIVATMFRDILVERLGSFPHLFLAGVIQAGKSKFGEAIAQFFTPSMNRWNLHSGTKAALYRRLERFRNVAQFLDEYNNTDIDDSIFQSLKAAYDNTGREISTKDSARQTTVSKINCSCIIAGQYFATKDGSSLASRSCSFEFSENKYTADDERQLMILEDMYKQGLNGLMAEFLTYRDNFIKKIDELFLQNLKRFKDDLKNEKTEGRIVTSYCVLYSVMDFFNGKVYLPFELEDYYELSKNQIIRNSEMISTSDQTTMFFDVFSKLINSGQIAEEFDYKVGASPTIKTTKNKLWKNDSNNNILFIRFKPVYIAYLKEMKMLGIPALDESTLMNYFKNKPFYIGTQKSKRFKTVKSTTITTALCFNLTMMEDTQVLNLGYAKTEIEDEIPFI